MIYPDFKELLRFQRGRSGVKLFSLRDVSSLSSGVFRSPFRGQGLEFDEVREYAPGDDVRYIDWRVTARMDKPYLKVFAEEKERSVVLCVDVNDCVRFGARRTFKSVQAARAAAILGWRALDNHDRVGGALFGDVAGELQFFSPSRSRQSFWRLLKQLCVPVVDDGGERVALDVVLRRLNQVAPTGSLVFVVSDFCHLGEWFEQQLGGLRRRCDVVFVEVSDRADRQLPVLGKVRLSSDRGASCVVDVCGSAALDLYQAQWDERVGRLEAIAVRLGIGRVFVSTEDDVFSQLFHSLRFGRSRRGV